MPSSKISCVVAVAVCTALIGVTPARADDDNQSACGAVLCLGGLMQGGDGGRDCSRYEANYFSIVRYHHGHFDLSGTSSARGDFLNQCRSAGSDQKRSINAKYGAVENGP
ncbi:TrbM/KikA/MpfK family conjugal transfer protein [Paraburkholderia caribensis]|uniref:Killer protein, putative n=2 Tax=Paraburkholderia TaxID=1822464 RepID=B2JXU6_PARP8|nr:MULTISPECIES: TrbM/KikA/MpfK family conjugal transfer protein [Paraburkholderia]ACC76454.1 killer protein, putative [Paraburkholderia phymatum STM815]MCO4879379.1 killer protein [Paraburkholderia caribensis]PTB23012.1 killer protein [Paraburkholderia caribensis]